MRKIGLADAIGILGNCFKSKKYLEKDINHFFKRQFNGDKLFLNSGEAAIQALIDDWDLHECEIIIPSFICSDVFTRLFVTNKITPILVDCRQNNLNISIDDVTTKITPRTKAILIVHTLGLPANPEGFKILCKKNNLLLIEDCAHSLSLKHNGKFLGSFGDASIFSFVKEMPNFVGGMYLNNRRKIKSNATNITNFKWTKKDVKNLLQKLWISRLIRISIPKSIKSENPILSKIRKQTIPLLGKAILVHYLSRFNIKEKRKMAIRLHSHLTSEGLHPMISLDEIRQFSAKSFPVMVKNQDKVLNELFKIGLNPGKGWTPVFSQNALAQKTWQLPRTPVAENYSKKLVTISLDEVNQSNISKIISVIVKDSKS